MLYLWQTTKSWNLHFDNLNLNLASENDFLLSRRTFKGGIETALVLFLFISKFVCVSEGLPRFCVLFDPIIYVQCIG